MACRCIDVYVLASFNAWLELADCFSDTRKTYASIIKRNPELRSQNFLKCKNCGFISVDPMPVASALTGFYQSNESTAIYSKKEKSKLTRATRRIARLKKHMPTGSFIDIGCNIGFTVEAARRLGFTATGLEIDAETVALAQMRFPEAGFIAGTISDIANSSSSFDIVYCADVIEHVVNVQTFASGLAKITRQNGILFLGTPDAGHWRVPRNFLKWEEVKPPQHLCWFTRKSLKILLEEAGFTIISFGFNLKPGLKVMARRN
jgi:SAM-dependent methyltransferase